jgi:hypothetical protein
MVKRQFTWARTIQNVIVIIDMVLAIVGVIGVFTNSYRQAGFICILVGLLATAGVIIWSWKQAKTSPSGSDSAI